MRGRDLETEREWQDIIAFNNVCCKPRIKAFTSHYTFFPHEVISCYILQALHMKCRPKDGDTAPVSVASDPNSDLPHSKCTATTHSTIKIFY